MYLYLWSNRAALKTGSQRLPSSGTTSHGWSASCCNRLNCHQPNGCCQSPSAGSHHVDHRIKTQFFWNRDNSQSAENLQIILLSSAVARRVKAAMDPVNMHSSFSCTMI